MEGEAGQQGDGFFKKYLYKFWNLDYKSLSGPLLALCVYIDV